LDTNTHQINLDAAMGIFWRYLTNDQRWDEFQVSSQQVLRLQTGSRLVNFERLINLSVAQLTSFRQQSQTNGSSDTDVLEAVDQMPKTTVKDLLKIAITTRKCCYRCGRGENYRVRAEKVEDDNLIWAIAS
jgi:hypothetical protein